MATACENAAKKEIDKLGSKFKTSKHVGKPRVNVSIYTDDPEAIQDNLRNNTVLKSLGLQTPVQQDSRNGKVVAGYYRTLKNGKTIYVQSYQRRN